MMFVERLAKLDSTCEFQQARLRKSLSTEDLLLYQYIDRYLEEYCHFYGLEPAEIIAMRDGFAQRYLKDLLNFEKYRSYPHQLERQDPKFDRITYDVVLILSFLIEKHRFRIAKWLVTNLDELAVLCVGIGPGVELGLATEFRGNSCRQVIGYDTSVSDFVKKRFGNAVHEECFTPDRKSYEAILLVEILEHLHDPENLIGLASKSLTKNGRVFLTTAIDMPQFDHLYNFTLREIVGMLEKYDLYVCSIEDVKHVLNISPVQSANELVIAGRSHMRKG